MYILFIHILFVITLSVLTYRILNLSHVKNAKKIVIKTKFFEIHITK